ncbi:MAG: inorganic phosphate transporter [Elusimicrobiota bacterium]
MKAWLAAGLVCVFCFMNGANDCGTMAASVVSSRCLSPRRAALLAAVASLVGAVLLGTAVAKMLGAGLLRLDMLPASDRLDACIATLIASLLWAGLAWLFGMPAAYTHALLGAWCGGFVGVAGWDAIRWDNAGVVFAVVLLTPVIGLATTWACMRWFYGVAEELSFRTLGLFQEVETFVFAALCLGHGANAAQKGMALLAVSSLALAPLPSQLTVPLWARVLCALAFSLGVLCGFVGTLKTVGFRIFRVGTLHSVMSLGVSGVLNLVATLAGLPTSAAQINSSSLLGAGAARNELGVRWDVAMDMLAAWVLTFPVCAVVSYSLTKVLQ